MKVLFAVWELGPFFKVGGLGDVARSLPIALSKINVDIRVIFPYYKAVKLLGQKPKKVAEFKVVYDGRKIKTAVYQISFPKYNIPVYLVRNDNYLNVPDDDTFAFFNLAIIEILKGNLLGWIPDIIHCNDHHTGFIPLLVKHQKLPFKTLMTIHNLDNQGLSPIELVKKMGIEHTNCRVMKWEIKKRKINFLLEAIIHADLINTVSPTYAKEILHERYGAGLDEILGCEKNKIYGILNGIDYDIRNPFNDHYLPYHYSSRHAEEDNKKYKIFPVLEGKKLNKLLLQKKLGLKVDKNIPLIGFIGRFSAKQKGIDILHKLIRRLSGDHYQFVILGTGDINWEERFRWFNRFYPKNVFCDFEFDEALASQIYAASDFLVIPSKFEPCGLIQMIAMCYGSLPIARATGGLKDSIDHGKDGFLFRGYSSFSLEKALKQAVKIMINNKERYHKMVIAAMNRDFSWDASAKRYVELYQKLINNEVASPA